MLRVIKLVVINFRTPQNICQVALLHFVRCGTYVKTLTCTHGSWKDAWVSERVCRVPSLHLLGVSRPASSLPPVAQRTRGSLGEPTKSLASEGCVNYTSRAPLYVSGGRDKSNFFHCSFFYAFKGDESGSKLTICFLSLNFTQLFWYFDKKFDLVTPIRRNVLLTSKTISDKPIFTSLDFLITFSEDLFCLRVWIKYHSTCFLASSKILKIIKFEMCWLT